MWLPSDQDVVQQMSAIAVRRRNEHQLAFMKEDVVEGVTSIDVATVGGDDQRRALADRAKTTTKITLAIPERQVLAVRRAALPFVEQLLDTFEPLIW